MWYYCAYINTNYSTKGYGLMNFRKFIVSVLTAASLASLLTTAGCGKDKNQETATDAPAATDSLVNTETEKEDFSNKVKVILMAGQSNMAGATYNPTKYDVGEDTYKKYRKGFENIQIMFSSGVRGMPENQWHTSRTVFQKVKPGQGAASMKNLFCCGSGNTSIRLKQYVYWRIIRLR